MVSFRSGKSPRATGITFDTECGSRPCASVAQARPSSNEPKRVSDGQAERYARRATERPSTDELERRAPEKGTSPAPEKPTATAAKYL